MCIVVVDIFRMLYVLGSDEAKAANMHRFGYFLEITDDHTKEFSSQLARVAIGLKGAERIKITVIERDCAWVCGQIKRRNDVVFDFMRCFSVMRRVVANVYSFLESKIPTNLSKVKGNVIKAFNGYRSTKELGGITDLQIRLYVQSKLLSHIGTIARELIARIRVALFLGRLRSAFRGRLIGDTLN